jgi:hypothetical protein
MARNRLLLNDGSATFADETFDLAPEAGEDTRALALVDVDGDGDADLVEGHDGQQNRLDLNLTRQLLAPFPARIGTDYRLDGYSRPAGAPAPLSVAYALSLGESRTPIPPLGTFGLDPAFVHGFPLGATDPATACDSLQIAIPANQGLIGVTFFVQALAAGPGSNWKFTNVVRDRIVQ